MYTELFERLRNKYSLFYQAVKGLHDQNQASRNRGHGMDHNVHVALYGLEIAVAEGQSDAICEQVFLAAIAHSIDRLFERGSDDKVRAAVLVCLDLAKVDEGTKQNVLQAVMEHSKKNSDLDNIATVILKDADRCANFCLSVVIRSGQFHPEIPPCEMNYLRNSNPTSTYREPTSVVEDLRGCFDWIDWMRTRTGRGIVSEHSAKLRCFLNELASQYENIGLDKVEI